jgi:hypothetical protein
VKKIERIKRRLRQRSVLKLSNSLREEIRMAKKPRPPVVDASTPTASSPPATLGEPGRTLWSSIMSEYQIADSGGLAMLAQACAAVDRIAECGAVIEQDGMVVRTKSGVKEHPLLKIELAARAFTVRTLHRLGLDVEAVRPTAGRPGRGFGWMPPA